MALRNTPLLPNARFVRPEELDVGVDTSLDDIRNFLAGNWAALSCRQIAWLKACQDDPYDIAFNRDHADCITCDTDWLLENLWVYYPVTVSFAEALEDLRRRIGPRPIGYAEAYAAFYEILCEIVQKENNNKKVTHHEE